MSLRALIILVAFLLITISFSTHYASASSYILNGGTGCTTIGGTWSAPACNLSTTLILASGDSLIIDPGATLDITITGNLTNNSGGTIINSGTIAINSGGTINVPDGGAINNKAGGAITNNGTITNNFGGAIINDGKIYNYVTVIQSSTYNDTNYHWTTVEPGAISNLGTIHNLGNIYNAGGTITNAGGTITNAGILNNTGIDQIYNGIGNRSENGTINNKLGGTINNSHEGLITNGAGGIINNDRDSKIGNLGEIANSGGDIYVSNTSCPACFGVIIIAEGIINNTGTIINGGQANFVSFDSHFATIDNNASGIITNSGTINNYYTTTNNLGAVITNTVTINDYCRSIFIDNGIFSGNPVQDLCFWYTGPIVSFRPPNISSNQINICELIPNPCYEAKVPWIYIISPSSPSPDMMRTLPILVYLDDAVYDHNSVIILHGHVNYPYPGQDVTLKITDPSGNIVHASQMFVDNNGNFTTTVNTSSPLMSQNGVYTVYTQLGDQQGRTYQIQFVLESTVPEFGSLVGIISILAIIGMIAISRKFKFVI